MQSESTESTSFSDFELASELLESLTNMALQEPTEVQQRAIPAILDEQDVVITASTGSGKTLAYLVPLAQKILNSYEWLEQPKKGQRVQALIVAPTRELASQITDVCDQLLEHTELTVCGLVGGEDFKVQQKALNRFPDMVVATPGRLIEHLDARSLSLIEVATVVLDESDQLCDLGFTEDVQTILGYVDEAITQNEEQEDDARRCQTLMVSATTTGRTRKLAADVLNDPVILTINARRAQNANIRQQMLTADDERHKLQLLLWLFDHEPFGRAFVFVNTKTQADNLCGKLRYHNQRAAVLHSDMKQSVREGTLKSFKEGRSNILVATDLAARGLDVENVDIVVNFDMARKGDEYMHRIGRTGRGGAQGQSFSLIMPNEWNLMASIERYLKIKFERRFIPELKGSFNGPKKLKASGKAAGVKKKKTKTSAGKAKAGAKSKKAKPKKAKSAK
ncbi:DEAD/DEAH box helicase [Litoribrevibacter albus]|uniref:ATP-dependent RNA helicase n=1 Tax=Litoribrevibacter albus TaxID=1473156 RepID=A0AA37S9I7_9GAMM|nr:DEAD/DEAH box helicase [Litoribrevibacter albus]GLQ30796.1 ATP-dependent RNA helicase [Litoribrevibacter albus]